MSSSHSGSHSSPEVFIYLFVCVGILPRYHCHCEIKRDVTTQGFTLEQHFPRNGFADEGKKKKKVSQTDVEVGCVLLFGSFSLPYVCKVLF